MTELPVFVFPLSSHCTFQPSPLLTIHYLTRYHFWPDDERVPTHTLKDYVCHSRACANQAIIPIEDRHLKLIKSFAKLWSFYKNCKLQMDAALN